MQAPVPFFREAGSGPGVVCLHSNAGSSSQWRTLMDRLAPAFHVLAADGYGAGKSPAWLGGRPLRLDDEVALMETVFAQAGETLALVGHSYGAAVALVAALAQPHRIRGLALYEPTLFSLLDTECPPPNDADGIRHAVARAGLALDAGDAHGAAECFIDYWMGPGAWLRTPAPRKPAIAEAVTHVRDWAGALFNEGAALAAFSRLQVPVLYMTGRDSPSSSRSVARLLTQALPQVQVIEFEGLGHMGPLTHPERVNLEIHAFLDRLGR